MPYVLEVCGQLSREIHRDSRTLETREMRCFLFVILLSFIAAAAVAEDIAPADTAWPMLRGGAGGGARCSWPDRVTPPEIREWHFQHKSGRRYEMGVAVWASPAIAIVGGRPMAFIGGYDQTLHALDLMDKEEKWSKITNGNIQSPPAIGKVDDEPVVYWGSADRSLYAHFAATGLRLWTVELVKPTSSMAPAKVSAPLIHNGVVYITCFAHDKALARNQQKAWLIAVDAKYGDILWRKEVSQGPVSSPVGRMLDGRFRVFVAAQKGLLQAYDCTRDGARSGWTYQMPHEVLASPVIEEEGDDPLLFLGSKFGNLIAINGRTGKEAWKVMAGNWIDNTACIGEVNGERVVFVGSHDYRTYALRAIDGSLLWYRHLGGEVYAAPAFFNLKGKPAIAVCALDNHLYILDAADGRVITSYFTGTPIWDKVSKGETLWGSPAVFEAGESTAIVHGSFNDTVYILPIQGDVSLRAQVQSSATLWIGLGVVLVLFFGAILPLALKLPERRRY
jgi:outer membrane protein assembly factor BamB